MGLQESVVAPPAAEEPLEAKRRGAGSYAGLAQWLFVPVVAPLIRRRGTALALGAAGLAQVIVGWWGQALIPCPMLNVMHVPCPGCGITRAAHLLLERRIGESLQMHAFAGLFLLAAGFFAVSAFVPGGLRERLTCHTTRLEHRTGLVPVLLLAIVLYWATRLIYSGAAFVGLMRGA